jgi:hypothetical protein
MGKNPAHRKKTISIEDAARAIYIDFEGLQGKPPTLCGILVGKVFTQVVYDQAFDAAAYHRDLQVIDFSVHMMWLLEKCESEKRYMVAFSEHEMKLIRRHAEMDVSHFYRNANLIAKRWLRHCRPDAEKCNNLKDYLDSIKYKRRRDPGIVKVGPKIIGVGKALRRCRGDFSKVAPADKTRWNNVLEHNRIDCKGMAKLVEIAAKEMAST